VVVHDDTVDRTTNGAGAVSTQTLAALKRLDAGTWFEPTFRGERIPTLAEVLAEVRLPVNVELKAGGGPGLEARTLEVVVAAQALQRVVFSSFDPESLVRMRDLTADADLAVLWTRRAVAPAIHLAKRVGARGLHLRKTAVDLSSLAAARENGLEVRVWTVNEPREFEPLGQLGATGVFTDYPERFLQSG
jgi:glycerophosphoryl diester phosphodiesterase